ncbi:FIG00713371: hypothetical protein [Helicobacter bizzozeronii CIII-1]|uniref:Cytidine monophosphate-N-acetylneuraminic acid hydroxylase n=1 Tax=Helicobacter bizzozeronii (strain CIII-1) TaxID=1002804 RepID=F8KTN6_HELBC|nr:MBL fold metallo-hydrolase [Helicobacter bizzozeronii]CCB80206.1 FIG00713371: hypothetical protein [Helicobacter bizzozeronii CIII-1]
MEPKHLGRFSTQSIQTSLTLPSLQEGIYPLAEGAYFVKIVRGGSLEWVINNTYDHMGNPLCGGGNTLRCPKHGWVLDLNSLTYTNGACKRPLDPTSYTLDNHTLTLISATSLTNPYLPTQKGGFICRYLNHACLYFESAGLKIITDPWLVGPAFLTGWWLASPSSQEAMACLQEADVIYISHNHPDHLGPETFVHIPKDKFFICANFESQSTKKALKSLGFTRVIALDFGEIYAFNDRISCAVFKSGDFRDDSGLYLCLEGHEVLLSVDSNFLNRHTLPQHLTLPTAP